ncbi:MAG: ROK family protein [Acidimicrobiia bacterium]|nr:ROK family protein [Acidimicrobiia bacterium]
MSSPVTVGVDLGGTKMVGGLVSPDGAFSNEIFRPRPATHHAMLEEPLALIDALLTPEVAAIGLGVAGLIDANGRLAWGPNIAGTDLAVRELTEAAFGLPVIVDNDANFWALAEATLGAAAGHDHAVIVTLGTGIGGGLIADGRVYRGGGHAGEFGHMVVAPGGDVCTCGNRGCWETLVSGRRLDTLAREIVRQDSGGLVAIEAGGESPTGRHLLGPALSGDRAAMAAYIDVGEALGRGLATLAVILDPQIIVIGGAVAEAGELLLSPARQAFHDRFEGAPHRPIPTIVTRHLGANGGAIGAGLAAHRLVTGT